MKRVFVTGISGLLGTNLVMDLLEQGFSVKGLVRDPSRYRGPGHSNLEIVQGGLGGDLTEALSEVDVCVHVAAETRQDLIRYSQYREVNYDSTVNLYESAKRAGVSKFVFVSTANTLGYGSAEDPGTEQKEMRQPFSASFYARSKREAEEYLLSRSNEMDSVIINPTFMLGPHDSKPSSGKIILMGWKKRLVFYPPGGKNFVHVRDVSRGVINSIQRGRSGERYLIANDNLSYREFFQELNRVTGQEARLIGIPGGVLIAMGHVGDLLRFFRLRTSLCSAHMRILCVDNYYSNAKSIDELGIDYSPVEHMIRDAVDYFERENRS